MRAENDFPRPPQLKRHRSMADVARIHKQNGITNSLDYRQMPDTNLNYSPPPVVVSPDMPASDGPNFLLRVGPQVFMNAGRDTSISTVNNEVSLRSDLGDLILKVCESSDDNGDSDVPIDSTSKKSRFWDFLMDDLLGFQSRARSPDEKRKQREANMEICDPVLLLAFALWLA